ncbi:MAG: glycosyltransferase family 1 protein, partial [Hymenobacter sp.]
AQLHELFSTADFFILPSRAECAAIAFCDANSFGLPVLTTDVGGISSFIQQGVNGYMLPLAATGQDFAQRAQQVLADPAHYQQLRQQSRQQYESVLNWDKWSAQLYEVLGQHCLLPASQATA